MSTQPRERQRVISYKEGAHRLNVSYATFRRYVSLGRIRGIRVGPGRVGVTEDEIDRVIAEAEAV